MKHAKIFTLLCVSSMIICNAKAQTNNLPLNVYASAGIAVPVGQFASKNPNPNDVTAAHAKIGTDRRLGVTYRFSKYVGISFLAGFMLNPYTAPTGNTPQGEQLVTIERYGTRRLMAGPTFTYPFGTRQKWDITASALAGIANWSTGFVSEANGPGDTIALYKANKGNAFVYQAGAKIQCHFARHWQASLEADFLGMTFPVANELITTNPEFTTTISPQDHLPIHTVNASLGIGFLL